MKISIAEYLINSAVRTAAGLNHNTRDGNNHAKVRSQQEKEAQNVAEVKRTPASSSAYRVTISQAAMQKMASSTPA